MTELEIIQYKYEQMKKLSREIQNTLHYVSNIWSKDRHTSNTVEDCNEDSCKMYFKAIADIDRLETVMKLADYGKK